MKKNLTFGFCLLLVLAGAFAASQLIETESKPDIEKETEEIRTLSVPDATEYFNVIAKKFGGAHAFELLRKVSGNDNVHTHIIAHIIGVELYREEGVEGLRLCTTEFAFGCYHSLIASALDELGLSAVNDFNTVCLSLEDWWGCQHGIGHGVLSVMGYDKVFEALDVCASLKAYGKITGCVEGVFMEFNSLTMLDTSGETQREVSSEGMYYPCDTVAVEYQNTCYYELPSWWRGIYGQESYQELGALCEAVVDESNRAWCFRRIGLLRLDAPDGTVQNAAEKCLLASSDMTNQAHCLQMVRDDVSPEEMCSVLQSPFREVCESFEPER